MRPSRAPLVVGGRRLASRQCGSLQLLNAKENASAPFRSLRCVEAAMNGSAGPQRARPEGRRDSSREKPPTRASRLIRNNSRVLFVDLPGGVR